MNQKRILMIIGSLRKESFQRQLAQLAQEMLGERAEVAFLDYTQVHFFNQDMEFPVPLPVAQVREAVSRADGVWLFVPEYNHSLPGVLKNLLDWLSRPNQPGEATCLFGKPVTFSGAGGAAGTACVQDHLMMLLSVLGMKMMAVPRTGIPLSPEAFKSNCLSLTESQEGRLRKQAEAFLTFLD